MSIANPQNFDSMRALVCIAIQMLLSLINQLMAGLTQHITIAWAI